MGNWLLLVGSVVSFAVSTAFLVEADHSLLRYHYGKALVELALFLLLTVIAGVLFWHVDLKEIAPVVVRFVD